MNSYNSYKAFAKSIDQSRLDETTRLPVRDRRVCYINAQNCFDPGAQEG